MGKAAQMCGDLAWGAPLVYGEPPACMGNGNPTKFGNMKVGRGLQTLRIFGNIGGSGSWVWGIAPSTEATPESTAVGNLDAQSSCCSASRWVAPCWCVQGTERTRLCPMGTYGLELALCRFDSFGYVHRTQPQTSKCLIDHHTDAFAVAETVSTFFTVSDADINKLSPAECVDLFGDLLRADARRVKLPISRITISSNINRNNGGAIHTSFGAFP